MRLDVNATLLRHIGTGGGAAYVLREQVHKYDDKFLDHLADFFSARSDMGRLKKAQNVARPILSTHDFGDIMLLRDKVADQEQRRLISYPNQRDHTAHTLYLYLLGIWFFDNVTDIQNAILGAQKRKIADEEACKWFLFQWMFASLLHDIGYAFFSLSEKTEDERKEIDTIYQWDWLKDLYGEKQLSGRKIHDLSILHQVYEEWHENYYDKFTNTQKTTNNPEKLITNSLGLAPWVKDVVADWNQHADVFDILKLGGTSIKPYAMEVAQNGYGGKLSEGCVDHAVASGLLLFQYVSYWYWLVKKLRDLGTPAENTLNAILVNNEFQYHTEELQNGVVNACCAVAFHNVKAGIQGSQKILNLITLESFPILYLSILCDELQRWDRFPAGDANLNVNKEDPKSIEAEEIQLTCQGTNRKKASFEVASAAIREDIIKTLNERQLRGYADVVEIKLLS